MPPPKMQASQEEAPPNSWVAHHRCCNLLNKKTELHDKSALSCSVIGQQQHPTLTHLRGGHSDAAHGALRIEQGVWRITYVISQASSNGAFGMLLGVCDADVWQLPEARASAQIAAIFSKPVEKKIDPRTVAWGLCPSTGKLVTSHDVRTGTFGGALVCKQLVHRSGLRQHAKSATVVIELDMQSYDEDTALIAKREYATPLHPLAFSGGNARRLTQQPASAMPKYNTFSVSVNGGPMVPTEVRLPNAVFPWALMQWEGDAVTLESVIKISGDD